MTSLKGKSSFTHKVRFVSIGAVTDDMIRLSSEVLRSTDLQVSGSGLGSWTKEEVRQLFGKIIPEMLQLAADGKLKVETMPVDLKNIEALWNIHVPSGKRLVVVI
ncbi:hypothetical protein [Parafilimonas sp.]|uniref:hypothetical protein n=1 Tax=Parafilimonas sp. TaxID=1969739 RepID=UPI0039E590E4